MLNDYEIVLFDVMFSKYKNIITLIITTLFYCVLVQFSVLFRAIFFSFLNATKRNLFYTEFHTAFLTI